jgi:hypothetical protein
VSIGAVDIPVVLREVPAPPPFGQDAQPVDDSGADEDAAALERARSWRYALTYAKEAVAQDEVEVVVGFNLSVAEPGPTLALAGALDLFDHLARFAAVWPRLETALVETLASDDELELDPASSGYRRARQLVRDFHDLLAPLPGAWSAWRPPSGEPAASAPPGSSELRFTVAERRDPGTDVLVATRRLGPSTAKVWDPVTRTLTELPPPALEIDDGETVWTAEPMSSGADAFRFVDRVGNVMTHARASNLPRRATVAGLDGRGLDVAAYQNASAEIRVVRNRDLLTGVATAADFVYAASTPSFVAPVTPELRSQRAFDVGRLSSPSKRPLVEHVRGILGLLFAGTDAEQLIGLDVDFHQSLGPDLPPAVVPILQRPPTSLSLDGSGRLAVEISDQILAWSAAVDPDDGALAFKLRLFSTLSTSRPLLLELSRLMLEPADVAELS